MPLTQISVKEFTVGAQFSPQVCAPGTFNSGWMDVSKCLDFGAIILVGALNSLTTLALSWQQAQDSGGTGSKALTGSKSQSYAAALPTANSSIVLDGEINDLDVNAGFSFVRLQLVTVGGTGPLLSASLHQIMPKVDV
jgi:hypothetical protein